MTDGSAEKLAAAGAVVETGEKQPFSAISKI